MNNRNSNENRISYAYVFTYSLNNYSISKLPELIIHHNQDSLARILRAHKSLSKTSNEIRVTVKLNRDPSFRLPSVRQTRQKQINYSDLLRSTLMPISAKVDIKKSQSSSQIKNQQLKENKYQRSQAWSHMERALHNKLPQTPPGTPQPAMKTKL
jgi:hypothetical protein